MNSTTTYKPLLDDENKTEFYHIGEAESNIEEIKYFFTEKEVSRFHSTLSYFSEVTNLKQDLYITALQNLFRKVNFLELFQELSSGAITDVEFENFLNDNSNKYSIRLNKDISPLKIKLIVNIISKIGNDIRELSYSEVAELFSIKNTELLDNFIIEKR